MKFGQQLGNKKTFVFTKFRGSKSRGFSFSAKKTSRKFYEKDSLIQKRRKTAKNILLGYISVNTLSSLPTHL